MTDLLTREQFAALVVRESDGLWLPKTEAAYSAALMRIEELEAKRELAVEDYWRQYREAVAAEVRAMATEQRAAQLEAKLSEAMPYFTGAGRFTGMEAVVRGSDND